jgi:hypothetical protein
MDFALLPWFSPASRTSGTPPRRQPSGCPRESSPRPIPRRNGEFMRI